eukprot:1107465-Lingulodinium_polyedra.AAC.1
MAARITGMILELGNQELLAMLDSRQHLEARIAEAMGMLDAARAAAGAAAEAAAPATQAAHAGVGCPMEPDDPDGAEGSLVRARHSELDGRRSAL